MCPLFYFYYHLTRSGIFVIFHYPKARKRQHGDCHNVTIPPVWQCKTAHTASQNGPFCTAMTKARQTGCGSTGCAKCHDMTKNSHHMAPHHVATTQPSHTATTPPAAPQTPGTSGRQTGTYRKPAQISSENNRNGQRHCITTCRIETFFMFFHCRLQFYSYICIRLGAWEARQNATPRSHNATPGRH